jgi:hypothetical protein
MKEDIKPTTEEIDKAKNPKLTQVEIDKLTDEVIAQAEKSLEQSTQTTHEVLHRFSNQ